MSVYGRLRNGHILRTVWKNAFPCLLLHLHCPFFSCVTSILSQLYFTLLLPLSAWVHTVLCHTRTPFRFCWKGYILFSSLLHFSKGRSNHCCSGADARGWSPPPTPETCGSGIFQTCAERYEGYFRAQKHVFKLDMAFNYFCGSVIS